MMKTRMITLTGIILSDDDYFARGTIIIDMIRVMIIMSILMTIIIKTNDKADMNKAMQDFNETKAKLNETCKDALA